MKTIFYICNVMQNDYSMQILKKLFCEKDIIFCLSVLYPTYQKESAQKLNELIENELAKTRAESQNIDILEITQEHLKSVLLDKE
ncbi:hypothetical protein [Helicobacter bilis]|nr:hypothetical protein [Helicobacter bilis]